MSIGNEALIEGDRVWSHFAEVCELPESFVELCGTVNGEESWELGVGLRFNNNETVCDTEIQRYFRQLGARQNEIIGSEKTNLYGAAVLEIAKLAVDQYKRSKLFLRAPNHQLFGTVFRKYVEPEDRQSHDNPYDDGLWHIDFVPPDNECEGYFFWNNNPTQVALGGFQYPGILKPALTPALTGQDVAAMRFGGAGYDCRADRTRGGLSQNNRLYYTRDARTLNHRRYITEKGYRTFGRFFVGPLR